MRRRAPERSSHSFRSRAKCDRRMPRCGYGRGCTTSMRRRKPFGSDWLTWPLLLKTKMSSCSISPATALFQPVKKCFTSYRSMAKRQVCAAPASVLAMLADGVRNLEAHRIVLFLDACQSGSAVEPLSQIAEIKAKVATGQTQVAPTTEGHRLGVGVHVIAATLPLSFAVQITEEKSALAATRRAPALGTPVAP
jgi:hypothetical protein